MEGQQVPCLSAGSSVPLPHRQRQGRDRHCPRLAAPPVVAMWAWAVRGTRQDSGWEPLRRARWL